MAKSLHHLLQGLPLEVLIDAAAEPTDPAEPVQHPPLRLGVASCIKGAEQEHLSTWLAYHAHEVGVERFFLRIEDTPSLQQLLGRAPWTELVVATYHDGAAPGGRDFQSSAGRTGRRRRRWA